MAVTTAGSPVYEASGITFDVGGRRVLHGIDLSLQAGRICGLVGPNGSGKSTLLKLLARQQVPAGGSLRLHGRSVDAYGDREFARTVSYLPQFTPAAEGLTVRELVGLGRFPWHGPLGRFSVADAAKVEQALASAALQDFADRQVDRLSGGERQRAWLAMMLAQDTGCLLLDEPTSALDIAHQVEMLALVRNLSATHGHTILVVLHDINMAARYCDEIVALRDGRVVARGTPEEIVEPDALARIYGLAMGIVRHPATGAPISYVR